MSRLKADEEKILFGAIIAENLPDYYASIIEKDFTVGYSYGLEFKRQGMDPDNFKGATLEEVFGDSANIVREYYTKTFNGESCIFELFINDQYQQYKTLPIIESNGEIKRIISYVENISDRKLAEIELNSSKEKFKSLYDNAPLPYHSLNEDGTFRDVNPAWLRTLGYSKDEVVGKPYADFLHPDWKPHFEARFPEFKKRGYVNDVQFKIRHKDGHYLDISFEGCIGYNPDGSVRQTYCVFQDITERKKYDEILFRSEEKFRILADNTNDWEYWIDQHGKYIFVSKSCEKISGYNAEEYMANPELLIEIVHPEDKKHVHDHYSASGKRDYPKYTTEFRIINKKNEIIWIEHNCIPVFDDKGTFLGRRGNNRDITKRKEAEIDLLVAKQNAEKNEAFFMAALENSQAGIAIAGMPDGKLLFVNNAGLMIPDKKHEELVEGIDVNEYVASWNILDLDGTPLSTNEVPLAKAVLYGETNSREFIVRRDNMEDRIVWANAAPISDQSGTQIAAIVVFLDITDRKLAQKELKDSNKELVKLNKKYLHEKNKALESERLKAAFLANMSHEIRTPMNGIMGFLELIQETDLSAEDHDRYIEIIKKSGERLLTTINDIIQISRIEAGQVEIEKDKVDISELMKYFNDFFSHEAGMKGIKLNMICNCCSSCTKVLTDKNKIESILINLIKNAIKFTEKGSVSCSCTRVDNKLSFIVKDTGIGITKDRLSSIFDRFVQADLSMSRGYEGSGLGLSIVKAYVEMLGGRISVESTEGVGSTFKFDIDYIPSDQPESVIKSIEGVAENNKVKNILIAEDDTISFDLLKTVLTGKGFKITQAMNGLETVEILKRDPDFDVILMDLKMPVMDGLEATKIIRQSNNDIPIIAQTAYAFPNDRLRAKNAGCNDFITKPINAVELIHLINQYT